jgi:hypothetical protein
MPRERMSWVKVLDMAALNVRLRRMFDLTEGSTRYDVKRIAASATLDLTWPQTLLDVDTTAGNVTVTLPAAGEVPGYCVQAVKVTAANTFTLAAAAGETISGAASWPRTTQWDTYTVVSTGAAWRIV